MRESHQDADKGIHATQTCAPAALESRASHLVGHHGRTVQDTQMELNHLLRLQREPQSA